MLLRQLLVGAVQSLDDLEMVGEAGSVAEGIALLSLATVDIVVLDLHLSDGNGLELVRQARDAGARIIIVSGMKDSACAREALLLGVDAFVCKDESYDLLVRALAETVAGRPYYSPGALALLRPTVAGMSSAAGAGTLADLTPREREVLIALARGAGVKETASQCGISAPTVKTHRLNLMRKLGLHDVASLTRFAVAQGLVRVDG